MFSTITTQKYKHKIKMNTPIVAYKYTSLTLSELTNLIYCHFTQNKFDYFIYKKISRYDNIRY